MYDFVKSTGSQKELISLQDAVYIEALLWNDVYPWQVCSSPTQTGPAQDKVLCSVLQRQLQLTDLAEEELPLRQECQTLLSNTL